jgi:hypothetical protein
MRKPEQRLWDSLLRNCGTGPRLWLQRLEQGLQSPGWPDVLCVARATALVTWIELKVAVAHARASTPLLGASGLSVAQAAWHARWWSHGGRSFVLVREARRPAKLHLVRGDIGLRLNALTAAELAEISLAQNWQEISAVLEYGGTSK